MAEFYVHNIRPSRIAYRVGIDIDLIEKLIACEVHEDVFREMVIYYRKHRRNQRLKDSHRIKGFARVELQVEIEKDYREADVV